jgi:PKD repeat protein
LGSQCRSAKECEPFSWTDAIGQEIGDKCLPPETTIAGIYGEPLAEGLGVRSYNQLINAHPYWTQTEWSNEAGVFEGRCVQRFVNAAFSPPTGAKATVPTSFDGSASGEGEGDKIEYWVWNFGDKIQVGTSEPTVSHTYATPGLREVTLTVFDRYGNSNTHSMFVEVGAAPSPLPPPAPLTIKELITVKEASVPGHLTVAQLAAKLGLPSDGTKLSGNGPFALGHAECPPACGVTLQLYAKETKVSHKHRTSRWVLVGSAHVTLSAKGTSAPSLSLNAKGKTLLHKVHTTAGKLVVTVEGQEGGSWQIVRSLTIRR